MKGKYVEQKHEQIMDDVQQVNANGCERPVLTDFSEYRFHFSTLYWDTSARRDTARPAKRRLGRRPLKYGTWVITGEYLWSYPISGIIGRLVEPIR